MPVLWTLASGDPVQEVEEAERKLAARLHRTFKVKIGAQAPQADMARLRQLAGALGDRATLIVDANQAWDETVSARCLPQLSRDRRHGWWSSPCRRGTSRPWRGCAPGPAAPLMADENVFAPHDMLDVASAAAADVVSLKLVKHGGMLGPVKRGGGGRSGRHRPLRRLPTRKLHRRGSAPSGVRRAA